MIEDYKEKLNTLADEIGFISNEVKDIAVNLENDGAIASTIELCHHISKKILNRVSKSFGKSDQDIDQFNCDYDKLDNYLSSLKIPQEIKTCISTISTYHQKASIYLNYQQNKVSFIDIDAFLTLQVVIRVIKWYITKYGKDTLRHDLITEKKPDGNGIIIWNDISKEVSEHLKVQLLKSFPKANILCIDNCHNLISIDPAPENFIAIIILVTDCSKFSSNEGIRKKINLILNEFVSNGGSIIGSHDIIYKRAKNEKLEKLFKCQLKGYERYENAVKYCKCKNNEIPEAFKYLPEEFELSDGEVVTGNWDQSCKIIYENEKKIPLVVLKDYYSGGACIWINSGDYGDTPPKSIVKPEKNFVELLSASIKYFIERKAL